jgi:hypothetical protein
VDDELSAGGVCRTGEFDSADIQQKVEDDHRVHLLAKGRRVEKRLVGPIYDDATQPIGSR